MRCPSGATVILSTDGVTPVSSGGVHVLTALLSTLRLGILIRCLTVLFPLSGRVGSGGATFSLRGRGVDADGPTLVGGLPWVALFLHVFPFSVSCPRINFPSRRSSASGPAAEGVVSPCPASPGGAVCCFRLRPISGVVNSQLGIGEAVLSHHRNRWSRKEFIGFSSWFCVRCVHISWVHQPVDFSLFWGEVLMLGSISVPQESDDSRIKQDRFQSNPTSCI